MTRSAPTGPRHPGDGLWRSRLLKSAAVGAGLAATLCLLLWATAVAQVLPPDTPDFIRGFSPARGVQSLVSGLFWSMLFGALAGAAVVGVYMAARRPDRQGRA